MVNKCGATLGIMFVAMAISAQIASASDKLVGNWKLKSWVMEDVDNKQTKVVFGERPNGYLILTREGRMMAF